MAAQKIYPVNLLSKILGLMMALFLFSGFVGGSSCFFQHDDKLLILLLDFLMVCLGGWILYSVLREIEIGEDGISFSVNVFQVRKKFLWKDILKIASKYHLGGLSEISVLMKDGRNLRITSEYAHFSEIVSQIHQQFPINAFQEFEKKSERFYWDQILLIGFLLAVFFIFLRLQQ